MTHLLLALATDVPVNDVVVILVHSLSLCVPQCVYGGGGGGGGLMVVEVLALTDHEIQITLTCIL